jgi:phage terminase large subunit
MMAVASRELRTVKIKSVPAFSGLGKQVRYKVYYGGRGGRKSWEIARYLIGRAAVLKLRILCTREYQTSIADSVHRLLCDQIALLGLESNFNPPTQNKITSIYGSEFLFKGLRRDIQEIKSTEGIDICWVEEAQTVSYDSWSILIPTIRKENSEIIISFNTGEATDATYTRFITNPPPHSIVKKVSFRDNPDFPQVLENERLYLLRVDPEAYRHIWEGEPKSISDACVFKGKYRVESFETPSDARFFYGADWGFSEDPTVLVRCFIKDNCLMVDYESYGVGVELDEIEQLFDHVPGARQWRIRADNSRPETISYVKKKDFKSSRLSKNGVLKTYTTKTARRLNSLQPLQLKTESPTCASLKASSSMSVAYMPLRSSNYIPTRSIPKQSILELGGPKFCQ